MNKIDFLQDSYWLKNAHLSSCLLEGITIDSYTRENLALCDLQIDKGIIKQIIPANSQSIEGIDLEKKIILPCFVDLHTHLDKGHTTERSPNLRGDFDNALNIINTDQKYWHQEELFARMDFGLKCSYAHGTIAIRTHLDELEKDADIAWETLAELQQKWQEKLTIQGVCLVSLDYFLTPEGKALADKVAQFEGILGGVAYQNPQLEEQIEQVFQLASERNLDLDFHADETGNVDSFCLQKIAETALKYQFKGQIICGHCCNLSIQDNQQVQKTIELVKQANIGVISLPMCNLFLQGRKAGYTPTWRGVTAVHELKQQGIAIMFASDNCRDGFYGFGDHDMLEVFNQSVRICHLDTPYSDWIASVTKTPADLSQLENLGRFKLNTPANFIVFNARYFSELLSRPQSDRIVIRNGKPIDTTLPDYAELDRFVFKD